MLSLFTLLAPHFGPHLQSDNPTVQLFIDDHLVVPRADHAQPTFRTLRTELQHEPTREVPLQIQKYLSVLFPAVSREEGERVAAGCVGLVADSSADGVGIGVGEGLHLFLLEGAVGVVEGVQPGRVGRTGGIHVVLELPVVPTHQVLVRLSSHAP
jgi:hypothetical protein